MTTARVALVTCGEFPNLDADDRLVLPALKARDIQGVPVVWDSPDVDWARFDLAVIRSTWDYPERHGAFLGWAQRVQDMCGLANPVDAVRWNTDKTYLLRLAAQGLPVVPSTFLDPAGAPAIVLPSGGEYVIKPTVSAGSRETARYTAGSHDDAARRHIERLLAAGRTVMVQPYLDSVDTTGETGLLFIGGAYSHAIRKGPLLTPGGAPTPNLFAEETIAPRTPTAEQHAVAQAVLAAVPAGLQDWLYARVDLLDTPEGPVLLELELVEPSLFLATDPGAPDRLADAIAAQLSRTCTPGCR